MYHSYKNLFDIQWKIYAIGDKPLPRPIPLSALFLYILMFPIAYLLAYVIAGMFDQPIFLTSLFFDGFLTYFALSYDPQGRNLVVFLFDLLKYYYSPKIKDLNGCTVPTQRELILHWDALDLDG